MSAAPLVFSWRSAADPEELRALEWLITNGLGGYASGSVLGILTRRYHGLFIPNLTEPAGRYVLLSRLDEEIDSGDRRLRLGGAEYADGRLETDAYLCLREFRLERLAAIWRYEIAGRILEKSVAMAHGRNALCLRYRLLEAEGARSVEPLRLRLRPFLAFRRLDAPLRHAQDPQPVHSSDSPEGHELRLGELVLRLRSGAGRSDFHDEALTTPGVLYRVDRSRGSEHLEDLYSPGWFTIELRTGEPQCIVAGAHGWEMLAEVGSETFEAEAERAARLTEAAPAAARAGFPAQLVAAADQFIVLPGSRLEEIRSGEAGSPRDFRSIYAGYYWFADWGRDTMISLEGLTLCTGRHREAGAILCTFARYVHDGLLPNLFPEGAREALYHTADATLWYFHAIDRYRRITGDEHILPELYPTLEAIVRRHIEGTRFGIGVDARDGLLHAGAPGYQLTWMDAKVGDWVVTPRRGKPVEIQALWYNALRLMEGWRAELGAHDPGYGERAAQAQRSFNERFWDERRGYLLDVIDGEGGDDPSCRPNQIFSISLPHPVLERARWGAVLDCVRTKLLTPYGLRTLDPGHPSYRRSYDGDLRARDAAYHQGTVWPWLIGHFVDAWLRAHGDRDTARRMLDAFPGHLRAAGVGSIGEIFDAEPPHAPRGCIAQAWSVAEVLRAWLATEPGG